MSLESVQSITTSNEDILSLSKFGEARLNTLKSGKTCFVLENRNINFS